MIFIVSHDFNPIFLVFENPKNSDGIFGQKSLEKIIFIFSAAAIILRSLAWGDGLVGRLVYNLRNKHPPKRTRPIAVRLIIAGITIPRTPTLSCAGSSVTRARGLSSGPRLHCC